jgi:hypothetical protein
VVMVHLSVRNVAGPIVSSTGFWLTVSGGAMGLDAVDIRRGAASRKALAIKRFC